MSPRNRFTADSSGILDESKGGALGIDVSFFNPISRQWNENVSPFHKRIRSASRLDGSQILGSFNKQLNHASFGQGEGARLLAFQKAFFHWKRNEGIGDGLKNF